MNRMNNGFWRSRWRSRLGFLLLVPFLVSCNGTGEGNFWGGSAQEEDPDAGIGKFDFLKHTDRTMEPDPDAGLPEEITPAAAARSGESMAAVSDAVYPSPPSPGVTPQDKRREVRFYDDLILLDGNEELEVLVTFNSSPLVDVLPAFADILGFNYTASSELKGVVNVNLNSIMTRRELWESFDEMLRLAGATALADGDQLTIMPLSELPRKGGLRTAGRGVATQEVISRTLLHTGVKNISESLKNFVTAAGQIIVLSDANVILISDTSDNIAKLKQLLDVIDQPGRASWPRAVMSCRNVKPSTVATELAEVLPVIGLPVETGTGSSSDSSPGTIQLTGIDRLQIVVATAATEEAIEEIRQWIRILDNSEPADQERVYVYKVAHGKAEQLAQALSVIFSTQGTSLTVNTDSGNDQTTTLSTQRTQTTTSNTVRSLVGPVTNQLTNTESERDSGIFAAPVRLFADGVYNRLVIRTTPRTYAMIKALLDRLDCVPAQVLLQVLIVEVSLDDSTQFGMEFGASGTNGNTNTILNTNYQNMDPVTQTDGFTMQITDQNDPDEKFVTLRALAGRNNVKVVSSPQLVVTSHTEAKIQVGDDVPILTSDYTNSSSEGSTQRSYDYRETGIILTVTPQVTSTNLISLELTQTVSEAIQNTITTATDTPVIQIRQMETAMTIANGRTMIIGGLIQEKRKDKLSSVPILADIPLIGRAFGSTDLSVQRVELLVMITGYIITEKSPVEDMIRRYNASVKALSKFEDRLAEEDKEEMEKAAKLTASSASGEEA